MAELAIGIFDATSGKMAEGVSAQVRKIVDGDWQQLPDSTTKSNGQASLCEGSAIEDGGYFEVLVFLGAYFDQSGQDLPQIKLVDIVPLRFGVEPSEGNVDINMSITPHGYTIGFSTPAKILTLA